MICRYFFLVCIFVMVIMLSAYGLADLSDEGATISCTCGKVNFKKHIHLSNVTTILENIVKSEMVSTSILYYPNIIRDAFKKCSVCKITISKCWGHPKSENYACKESKAEFVVYRNETIYPDYRDMMKYAVDNISAYLAHYDGSPVIRILNRDTLRYPVYDHIPIGGLNRTREKRDADPCLYPYTLKTAELRCMHYPSKVICTQRCAFGYTLEEGTKLRYQCKKRRDKWHPHNFEECQPYVDCTISLTSGGKAECTTPTLTEGPICDVKCHEFEDKPAKSKKGLQCDINGEWSPNLPFCAKPGSGIYLVPPPEN